LRGVPRCYCQAVTKLIKNREAPNPRHDLVFMDS
jgi:hypothetical protein